MYVHICNIYVYVQIWYKYIFDLFNSAIGACVERYVLTIKLYILFNWIWIFEYLIICALGTLTVMKGYCPILQD